MFTTNPTKDRKFVLATRNRDKIQEIKGILSGLSIEILTLDKFPGAPDVVEDGDTLEANALKKARVLFDYTGLATISDDTGLEVACLNGEPGVFSGRYAGEGASYGDNVDKLLHNLKGIPGPERAARFRTIVAVIGVDLEKTLEGRVDGFIAEARAGAGGFGYDPIFYLPEQGCTFAELAPGLKNQISHRAQAFAALRKWLGE